MTPVGNLIQVLLQNFGILEISKRAVASLMKISYRNSYRNSYRKNSYRNFVRNSYRNFSYRNISYRNSFRKNSYRKNSYRNFSYRNSYKNLIGKIPIRIDNSSYRLIFYLDEKEHRKKEHIAQKSIQKLVKLQSLIANYCKIRKI